MKPVRTIESGPQNLRRSNTAPNTPQRPRHGQREAHGVVSVNSVAVHPEQRAGLVTGLEVVEPKRERIATVPPPTLNYPIPRHPRCVVVHSVREDVFLRFLMPTASEPTGSALGA